MKKGFSVLLAALMMIAMISGCGAAKEDFSPANPVSLTMWHVYGSQTNSPMNDLVDEFNRTAGKEMGIFISVTSVSNSDDIHGALISSAKKEPGAGALPDIFFCYPKTAVQMGAELLVDWNAYFPEDEMSRYVPAFVGEGVIGGRQVVFPVAKSTEAVFVNITAFDRFSAESGVVLDDLLTWEGMFRAMREYYEWTDARTPDIPGDGKAFMMYDMPFNYMQVAAEQLGGSFFDGESINFADLAAQKVWDSFAEAAANGWICLADGYATTQMASGNILCGVESSASVLYFMDEITYPDNTKEPLEIVSLPFPVFEGGKKTAMQRGVGVCALSGDSAKEKAAAEFCRWLTSPEKNTEFCIATGYMPVMKEAYDALFAGGIEKIETGKYRSLFEAVSVIYRDYSFYTPPLFDHYGTLQYDFVGYMQELLRPNGQLGADSPGRVAAASYQLMMERFRK